jgi:E3 ubiquitin-protein ligase synoviolin
MAFKFWHYFLLSSLLMFSMVIYACITREQFYPIILLLVTSKVSFLLISNMIFALTLLIGQITIKLFFGTLRDVEIEQIIERAKYSITETCLALTIFRNDLSPPIFAFFLLLLFLKVFHWLSRSRLDYLEQVARVSISTHTLLFVMLLLLIAVDSLICYNAILYSHSKGKTVVVLFAFEFGVLLITAFNNLIRYVVNIVDGRYENGLHYKGLYFMILDLICEGLKFCTYAGFFCLVFVYYGLPIHIIRSGISLLSSPH